jgi:hypothetical protein
MRVPAVLGASVHEVCGKATLQDETPSPMPTYPVGAMDEAPVMLNETVIGASTFDGSGTCVTIESFAWAVVT